MMDPFLAARLRPVLRRQRRRRLALGLTLVWLLTALVALGLHALLDALGWRSHGLSTVVLLGGLVAMLCVLLRVGRAPDDPRHLARRIEHRYPALDGRLLTAVQQAFEPDHEPTFLRRRLVDEIMDHARTQPWSRTIPWWQVAGSQLASLAMMAGAVWWVLNLAPLEARERQATLPASSVEVTPGHTELERGSSLVVMARFGKPVPVQVNLVSRASGREPRTIALVKSLSDPMFGGALADVREDLTYSIEFDGRRTEEFRVTVFEHPELTRADADLVYPAYTEQEPKRIEDVRRLTAVQGTLLTLELDFSKPVTQARFRPETPGSEPLLAPTGTNGVSARLADLRLESSQTYVLELTDADGRTNKTSSRFVLNVLTNRPPELRLAAPRGDVRPSALEEIAFEGTVWDDFGVQAYGLAYLRAGESPTQVTLGENAPAREKRAFAHLLRLEELSVAPDQLVCWYVWAEDIGPDGEPRRTTGDLYFAEIRPFEEIFREGQAQAGQPPSEQSGEPGGEQQSPSTQLAELQKQIISATWNLARAPRGAVVSAASPALPPQSAGEDDDLTVIRDSQAQALEQAQAAQQEASDTRTAGFWAAVIEQMGLAVDALEEVREPTGPWDAALSAEQSAYQALLRLQQREYEVARNRRQQGQQNANNRQQRMQRQLDQLDLTQAENRYETERQAQAPQAAERQEQLQVLNRLSELARRQEDVNQRLRELQTALQAAETEQEREDVRRELKRLQEEEQRLLADLDELQQRLDRPENQSRMAEQRAQLEQTREEMRQAAEAAAEGQASQALAAGTRAQRQMQEMRDELRRESASEFAEDLRQMRADARELVQEQATLGEELKALDQERQRTLTDAPQREALLDRLDDQKGRLTNLVERVRTVSDQAELTEPLVSTELYDTLRSFTQEEALNVKEFRQDLLARGLLTRSLYERLENTAASDDAKSLELTAEMLRQGLLDHAGEAERRARSGIDTLSSGVEAAAEKILGDDTEALRLAQRELDDLTRQVEREMAQANAEESTTPPTGQASPDAQPSDQAAGDPREADQPGLGGQRTADAETRQGGQADGEQTSERQPTELAQDSSEQPPEASGSGPTPGGNPREQAAGEGEGRGAGNPQRDGSRQANRSPQGGPGDLLPEGLDWLFGGNQQTGSGTGPITGPDFAPWSDRLREVEEMVDRPALRGDLARARERARELRREFREDLKKPDWAVVELEIVRPLVEVRDLIREELARREPKSELVPIDRDPVPGRFSELVRRYYEELGKDGSREAGP